MDDVKIETTEVAVAEDKPSSVVNTETNITFSSFDWMDYANIAKISKVASLLARSPMIPTSFKNDTWGVMIAMEMASKMKMSLMTVMSHLYIVQGKPSWSGAFCITAINGCGKFTPLEFKWLNAEHPEADNYGCIATAINKETGNTCTSAPITNKTVKDFGWDAKSGSMWNKEGMKQQMFMYRSAAYFARAYCPEVLSGLYTVEEQKDITGNYSEASKVVIE